MVTRLNPYLEKIGLKEQDGFMKNRGCADATSTLKIMLQNLQAIDQDTYVLYVDIVKAFDSVNREMLWEILSKYGLPDSIIAVIKKMYTNIQIKLKIDDAEAEFTSTSGVKQGDNLAPILFIFAIQAAIDTMHRNWPTTKPSLEWFPKAKGNLSRRCDNKKKFAEPLDLTDAFYADDSAFVFLSLAELVTGTQFVKDTIAEIYPQTITCNKIKLQN